MGSKLAFLKMIQAGLGLQSKSETKAEGDAADTKARFAELAGSDAETAALLSELEALIAEAEKLEMDWRPILQRHSDEMQRAVRPTDEAFVLSQAIADMQAPLRKARVLRGA